MNTKSHGGPAPLTTNRREKLSPVEQLACVIILLWGLGSLLGEGMTQGAAVLALLTALIFRKRISLSPDMQRLLWASLALFSWQVISPLVAYGTGIAPGLPRASRWSRSLDTLATIALASISMFHVPWRGLVWMLGVGWILETGLGAFQHLVRWPFGTMGPLHLPLGRLHESLDPANKIPRFAGMGFFFHRLRFAHGAIAALGPAISLLARSLDGRKKAASGIVCACLILSIYTSYARAALGAAMAVVLVAVFIFLTGRARIVALVLAVAVFSATFLSPTWRERCFTSMLGLWQDNRAHSIGAGFQIARDHPFFGVGFGNYKAFSLPKLKQLYNGELLSNDAHHYWLTVWAELGILGVCLALAFYASLAYSLFIRRRKGSLWAGGGLLSLIGFHILGLFHYLPFHSGVMLSFALFWGLGLAPFSPKDDVQ